MHIRATKHFQYGLLDPQRKEKKRKLFTRESSQQEKEERAIFWGFLFNTTTKHAWKINLLQLNFFQEESKKKKIKLAWIIQ